LLWYDLLSYAWLCLAVRLYALLRHDFALLCCARLCSCSCAMQCFAPLHFSMLCIAMLCHALLYFAPLSFDMPGSAMICFAVLSCA